MRYFIAAFAGGIAPFSYAPYHYYPLACISLMLLFWVWHRCDQKQLFYCGYLYGLFFFGIGIGWLYISIHLFGQFSLLAAYLITLLLVAFIALYPACVGLLSHALYRKKDALYQLAVLPSLWVFFEWCRSWVLTGFPWLNIGASQTDSIFAAYAPVFGVYGVSFILALFAGCLCLISMARQRIYALLLIFVIFGGAFFLDKVNWTHAVGAPLTVALVQGAVPQQTVIEPQMQAKSKQIYQQLSTPYFDRDLVVWPENAVSDYFYNTFDLLESMQRSMRQTDSVFLTGALYQDVSQRRYNSIVLVDDTFRLYKKQRLVPFGEYIPLYPLFKPLLQKMGAPVFGLSASTDKGSSFATRHGIFGLSICYESAFGHLIRGALPEAEALINISNDAWFGDSAAPHQHLQIARMRAIEVGRYMARAANTGISAIIDHKGKVHARSAQFKTDVVDGVIWRRHGSTPFVRWGYWPILSLCLFILLICSSYHYRRYSAAASRS